MEKELKIKELENRINKLEQRVGKANGAIVKKLMRQLRALRED